MKYSVGDRVSVILPHRYVRGAYKIEGDVMGVKPIGLSFKYLILASVTYLTGSESRKLRELEIHEVDLRHA